MVRFGGSEFINCSVPLVFEGRIFILEPGNPPMVTVVRDHGGQPVFEIKRNEPVENAYSVVSKSSAGIVTVGDRATGKFLYKIRPSSETSVVFGKIDGGETTVLISDKQIKVGEITLENCVFNGVGAGVVVGYDGSVGIGAPLPPTLLKWFSK